MAIGYATDRENEKLLVAINQVPLAEEIDTISS